MPSWPIHLSIAQQVNKRLKLNKNLFYYGNTIPDVDYDSKVNRYKAHYYGIPYSFCPKEEAIDIEKFLKDYKNRMEKPLVLGYYCHLITDNFYNKIIYEKYWVKDENKNIIGIKLKNNKNKIFKCKDPRKEAAKYKHHDLELYGRYLIKNIELPSNELEIKQHKDDIKYDILTDNLIEERFRYFNNKFYEENKLSLKEKIFRHNYKIFTKKELDNIFNECVEYNINKLNNILENSQIENN